MYTLILFFCFVLTMVVSLLTVNINAIAKLPKRSKVFEHLRQQKCDILLLQETIDRYVTT